jgi:diguanylate cyclase (GGDEF)-like protein/PAS domain S-box-containing protein
MPSSLTFDVAALPRLLLVDDDPRLLASLYALLDGNGYQLVTASSGREAIRQLGQLQFDLALLDLRMADIGGHEVMDFINERNIDVNVIVLSGDAGIDAAIGAVNRGAYGYLRKPYQHGELLSLVRNALEKRRLEAANRAIAWRLERSEKLYRFLIDSSPDIIYTLDPEGRFTYINQRVGELLGFDRDALIGAPYTVLIHEDDLERARYVFKERRIGERATRNVELRLKCLEPSRKERTFETTLRTISFNSIGMYVSDSDEGQQEYSGTYGIARDVTEKRRTEELISYQAYHDILTDLPNRALFRDRLELALAHARRQGAELGLMFIDLDRFKIINDSLGHLKGDELLRQVAARLKQCMRKGDTLARLGGDEFVVLLPELRERAVAAVVAGKYLQALEAPFVIDGTELHVSASIGVAVYPQDGETIDDLIRHADIAMYKVKAEGKNGYSFYDRSMLDAAHDKITMEHDLRRALHSGELEMYYQPQVDVRTGAIVSAEALMRWRHPERGLLSAGEFLPLVEEIGLMVPVSDWMVDTVCSDIRRLPATAQPLQVAINLSPTCLAREDFFSKLRKSLEHNGVSPTRIEVEITENICIRNPEQAVHQLKRLSELGVRIAIDDFGTGYSSLAYLHRFPIDTLKIDQSFVKEIGHDGGHFPVVLAVISIAESLGLNLVAEGVETELQADYLEQAGCRTMQGYLYHMPLSLQDLSRLVREEACASSAEGR